MKSKLPKLSDNKRGFSLVELAIVLVISGMMLYGIISVYAVSAEKSKLDNTVAKLDAIEDALRLHFQTLGDLPCPASGTLALNDANFGVGAQAVSEGNCTYDSYAITTVAGGVVPVRTLNLPDNYMFDAWGNRITYVVDDDCIDASTDAATWDTTCANLGGANPASITVKDNTGSNETRTSTAAYVLISHGKNGLASYLRNGNTASAPATTAEIENGRDNNATFRDDFIVDWDGAGASYFDDLVRWKIPTQISYED